jgi:quercetin dioxygenase-like cupin family protein
MHEHQASAGERPQAIHPGDTVMIAPNTMRWHGAAPDRLSSHLAMSENGEQGQGTTWAAEHVSDSKNKMEPATA